MMLCIPFLTINSRKDLAIIGTDTNHAAEVLSRGGILGIPTIACDLEPYLHCPVTRATANEPEEWVEKILSEENGQ